MTEGGRREPLQVRGMVPVLCALALVVVASVGAVVALGLRQATPGGLEPEENRIVVPAAAVVAPTVPVQVAVEFGEARVLKAPDWYGLVTAVLVEPGQTLREGDGVVRVGGLDRIVVSSVEPFHRLLGVGDSGSDVLELRRVLVRLGFLDQSLTEGDYDKAVGRAVAQLRFVLGGPEPRTNEVSSFDPGWFVFFGPVDSEAHLPVASVDLDVGLPAPGVGTEIVSFEAVVERMAVSGVDAGVSGFDPERRIEIGGVSADLEGDRVVLGSEIVEAVMGLLRQGLVGTQKDEYTGGLVSDSTTVSGVLTTTWPSGVYRIPLTSVVTSVDGTQCVVVVGSSGLEPFDVGVVGSETGSATAIVTGLSEGAQVVANPAWSGDDMLCLERSGG